MTENALQQREKDPILVAKLLDQFFFLGFFIILTAMAIAFVATDGRVTLDFFKMNLNNLEKKIELIFYF